MVKADELRVQINFLEWYCNNIGYVNVSKAIEAGYNSFIIKRTLKENINLVLENLAKYEDNHLADRFEELKIPGDIRDKIDDLISRYKLEVEEKKRKKKHKSKYE